MTNENRLDEDFKEFNLNIERVTEKELNRVREEINALKEKANKMSEDAVEPFLQ